MHIQATRECFALCKHCAQRSCMNTCMVAHAQHRFLVFANKTTLAVAGVCGHVSVYGLLGECAHVFLSMWVHVYFFSAIWNECWALISFGDICGSGWHCICGYPPSPYPPLLPSDQISPVSSFPVEDHWGGNPSIENGRGGEIYDWRAAAPTLFVLVLTTTCTMRHHDLTPAHTRPRDLTTPFHATSLHSHMFLARTVPPHSHLYFGYNTNHPGTPPYPN